MSTNETEVSFEVAIEQLEHIVAQLESGDVPLEKAIELYQEGVRLSHLCGVKLEQVEKKIEMLVEGETGTINRKPFQPALEDKGN
ncbi:exodeoxyribonuclease VII small subunit [Paenibacillus anseongense]|uniref:exodeoxyribonuclease VII small subunit n=1 Tax=Paenibacillus anseongense TaxID=2682845 RepID=UPI002DB9E16B|nr:exodeoxyribonuclease VII small subunit [Paenibacillus anseongense]MEC0266583.1 exodeoxyribonuclease VII small subunit [Paenibacillus anseongense]